MITSDTRDEPVGLDALLSFEGRISRATFWTTWLALACGMAAAVAGSAIINPRAGGIWAVASVLGGLLIFLFALSFFLMSLANEAKRFHDLDLSAWWLLLNLVPGLSPLMLFVLGLWPGTRGPNRFGDRPLQIRLNPESSRVP